MKREDIKTLATAGIVKGIWCLKTMYAKENISCTKNLKKIISDPSFLDWQQISVPIFHLCAHSDLYKSVVGKLQSVVAFTHALEIVEISCVDKGNLNNFSLNLFSFDFPTYKV